MVLSFGRHKTGHYNFGWHSGPRSFIGRHKTGHYSALAYETGHKADTEVCHYIGQH
jgi:hypothetical protein